MYRAGKETYIYFLRIIPIHLRTLIDITMNETISHQHLRTASSKPSQKHE
jgi:hypothetical protein